MSFEILDLVKNVNNESPEVMCKATRRIITIVLEGTIDQVDGLVESGVLESLCLQLSQCKSDEILHMKLDALIYIFSRSRNKMIEWSKRVSNCGGK